MKSELSDEYVTTKPASVEAKLRMAPGVAGSVGVGLIRCLPPTPRAMTNVTKTGIQATLSYLGGLARCERWAKKNNIMKHTR